MNKVYALVILELLVIVSLLFYFYNFHLLASTTGETQASFKEPPTLTTKINTTESLKNDLESLGCKIINSSGWGTPNSLANYTEFRRIAYNTGVIFWYDSGTILLWNGVGYTSVDEVALNTIFDGTILSILIEFQVV